MPRFRTRAHPASWSSKQRHVLFQLFPEKGLSRLTIGSSLLTLLQELRHRLRKHQSFIRCVLPPLKRFEQRLSRRNDLTNRSFDFQPLGALISSLNTVGVRVHVEQGRAIHFGRLWRELELAQGRTRGLSGWSEAAFQTLIQFLYHRHRLDLYTADRHDLSPKPQENEEQRPRVNEPERNSA